MLTRNIDQSECEKKEEEQRISSAEQYLLSSLHDDTTVLQHGH